LAVCIKIVEKKIQGF